jgi:hypothetical protein
MNERRDDRAVGRTTVVATNAAAALVAALDRAAGKALLCYSRYRIVHVARRVNVCRRIVAGHDIDESLDELIDTVRYHGC